MKQPDLEGGRAALQSFCHVDDVKSKVSPPPQKSNLFAPPSLGNHYQDAKNLAVLLNNMQSGMDTYHLIYNALERKYGTDFKAEFLREVQR